jgi:hypothetical protein
MTAPLRQHDGEARTDPWWPRRREGKLAPETTAYLIVPEILIYATETTDRVKFGRLAGSWLAAPLVPTNVPTGLAVPENWASDLEPPNGIEPLTFSLPWRRSAD